MLVNRALGREWKVTDAANFVSSQRAAPGVE